MRRAGAFLRCDNVTEIPEPERYTVGKIKTEGLIAMSAIHVNSNNFEQVVLNSDKPVLVDFWAPWCVPCRMQSPVVEQVAEELKETAVVAKVDVDESPELAAEFSDSAGVQR